MKEVGGKKDMRDKTIKAKKGQTKQQRERKKAQEISKIGNEIKQEDENNGKRDKEEQK